VFALLADKLDAPTQHEKIGALMGLSMTYAGSNRTDIVELVIPMILDLNNDIELVSIASITLSLICISSKNGECLDALMSLLMTRDKVDLDSPYG
jgi:26S proteasome regulatory subunit N1